MSAAPHGLLSSIGSPQDLRDLTADQLEELSGEIRSFLIETVCQTGGHLGPNLGVVELTLAVHRVFDSPQDPIIFDTGHQSYVHKILTGRQDQFGSLRQRHGLSGYPSRMSRSTTGWRTPTHQPRSPTPTVWPRPFGYSASPALSSHLSVTVPSPAGWLGKP